MVAPEVRQNVPARRRGGDQGAGAVLGRHAAEVRFLPIQAHINRRVIERLHVLQVHERGDFFQLRFDLGSKAAVVAVIRTTDGDFDRRVGPEAHDLVDDVRRLERQAQAMHALLDLFRRKAFRTHLVAQPGAELRGHLLAQVGLETLDVDAAAVFDGDADHRLFRTGHELKDAVERITRRNQPAIARGNGQVVRPPLVADDLQRLEGELLGPSDVCPGSRPQPQLKLPRIDDLRKNRGSDQWPYQNRRRNGQRDRKKREPQRSNRQRPASVQRSRP